MCGGSGGEEHPAIGVCVEGLVVGVKMSSSGVPSGPAGGCGVFGVNAEQAVVVLFFM